MHVVLIDHRDSFTINLAHLIRNAGASVTVVQAEGLRIEELAGAEGVVLGPGPHGPEELGGSLRLVTRLLGRVPLLGICLGHQLLGAASGASLRRARRVVHGEVASIHHEARGLFAGLASPAPFVRYHSRVLDGVSGGYRVTARDADGDIAAIEHETHQAWGVQFHPESVLSRGGDVLLANFLASAVRQ